MPMKHNHNESFLRQMQEQYGLYVRLELILVLLAVFTGVAAAFYFALLPGCHRSVLIAVICVEAVLLAGACGIYFFLLSRSFHRASSALETLENACSQLDMELPENAEDISSVIQAMLRRIEDSARSEGRNAFLRQQAELLALQSQINPHFLYNSLETIRGEMLARGNPDVAEMTEALAKFFRYNISKKGDLVQLQEELTNLDNYMAIQKYRFGSRVNYSVAYHNDGRAALDCLLPKLTLQPLVENAILHGLDPKLEGGSILIHVDATDKSLIITVSDDGVGMDAATLRALREKLRSGKSEASSGQDAGHVGIAVANINLRLKVLWGDEYGIVVNSTKGLGTDVELTMPLVRRQPEETPL